MKIGIITLKLAKNVTFFFDISRFQDIEFFLLFTFKMAENFTRDCRTHKTLLHIENFFRLGFFAAVVCGVCSKISNVCVRVVEELRCFFFYCAKQIIRSRCTRTAVQPINNDIFSKRRKKIRYKIDFVNCI